MSRFVQASEKDVAAALALVAPAEGAFRSRWRQSTLKRVDAELHELLVEQIDLYATALISAPSDELEMQAAAMVRGWAAACRAMEAQPDDAYLVGIDWATRTQVVISDSKQSIEVVKAARHPECTLVALSPEEVARLVGGMATVRKVKELFGDAEVIDLQAPQVAAAA